MPPAGSGITPGPCAIVHADCFLKRGSALQVRHGVKRGRKKSRTGRWATNQSFRPHADQVKFGALTYAGATRAQKCRRGGQCHRPRHAPPPNSPPFPKSIRSDQVSGVRSRQPHNAVARTRANSHRPERPGNMLLLCQFHIPPCQKLLTPGHETSR